MHPFPPPRVLQTLNVLNNKRSMKRSRLATQGASESTAANWPGRVLEEAVAMSLKFQLLPS